MGFRYFLIGVIAFGVLACGGARHADYAPAPAQDLGWGGDDYGGDGIDMEVDYLEAEAYDDVEEEITVTGTNVGRSTVRGGWAAEPAPPPAPPEPERTDIGKLYKAQKNADSSSSSWGSKPKSGEGQPGPQPAAKPVETPEKKVVYTGYLTVQVKRLMEAVDEVTRITHEKEGYVQSLSGSLMIVRIPGDDFEAVMDALSAVGNILDRRIEAMDVTAQYTDLMARLDIAYETRKRLVELLETTTDVKERIRIVEQITRLSDQIESMEATLASLKNLVDYYTIYIELQPMLDNMRAHRHRSPFSWIRNLTAHRTTIWDGHRDVEMALPSSFVLFEDTEEYRAQASDTTLIRVGRVDNEPFGDNGFWMSAVDFEMEARDEVRKEDGELGGFEFVLYESRDLKPRYYLIALRVEDDDLFVAEVFFPDQEAFDAHFEEVKRALQTVEVD